MFSYLHIRTETNRNPQTVQFCEMLGITNFTNQEGQGQPSQTPAANPEEILLQDDLSDNDDDEPERREPTSFPSNPEEIDIGDEPDDPGPSQEPPQKRKPMTLPPPSAS